MMINRILRNNKLIVDSNSKDIPEIIIIIIIVNNSKIIIVNLIKDQD